MIADYEEIAEWAGHAALTRMLKMQSVSII
jgi:hypothetical protein